MWLISDLLEGNLGATERANDTTTFLIIFLLFLVSFFIIGAAFEKYKPRFGHETGVTIILGMIFSGFFYWGNGANRTLIEVWGFKSTVFFDVMLPPIIFNSGFNMRRKKFFQNIGNIMIFGLCVTFFCFILYSSCSWWVLNNMNLTMTQYSSDINPVKNTIPIQMTTMKLLLFTSLLCSSDVVAAVSIVDFEA